jgi:WD40 repeat protein
MLASADSCTIRLWNPNTGISLNTVISLKTITIDSSWLNWLSFSPTSKLLALGAGPVDARGDGTKGREDPSSCGSVRVWNTNTGEYYCGFTCDPDAFGPSLGLKALVFSQDEKLLTALTEDRIWIWSLETKRLIQKLDRQEVALQQPLFDLVSESERDRDMLTHNFPSLCLESLDRSQFEPALYVKEHWVTWRKEEVLWLPPEYRTQCFRARDNILAMGHESGRVTFIEFDLDRIPLGGSIRTEL